MFELVSKRFDRAARSGNQRFDARRAIHARFVAMGGEVGAAALFDFGETVMQRFDQQRATLRVVEQIVLQIRIAAHDQISPSTSYSIRAERPVRRSLRNSSSAAHASSPNRRITISRSENDV